MPKGSLLHRLLDTVLHPITLVLASTAGVAFLLGAENQTASLPFACMVVVTVAAVLFAMSGRIGFSVYTAWAVVGLIACISAIKHKMKGFSLHFYDFAFFGSDAEIHRFLFGSYLYVIAPVLVAIGLTVLLAVIVFRHAPTLNIGFVGRIVPLILCLPLLGITFPQEAGDERVFYYMRGRQASAFFVSLLDIGNLFGKAELEARLHVLPDQTPFDDTVDCGPQGAPRPDIFVVLSESQANMADFPQVRGGSTFAEDHAPTLGEEHPLYVETFGGGTWITNLSLFTGLSATEFGWRSPYLTVMLQDRVRGTLPEVLSRCGYRTAVLTPMADTFVNEGPFLRSIGVETVLDIDDIGATHYHLRDAFYYAAAETFIAEHRRTDGRPLFLEIETMFAHSPFNERLEGDVMVPGEPLHPDAGVGEYLRRVAIARDDLEVFAKARVAEATERPSVLMEFGDHQAFVTQSLAEALDPQGGPSVPHSMVYRTYFTLQGFGHDVEALPASLPALDIAYLGPSLLDAARLPTSPLMRDMIALRDRCGGLFYTCADHAAVDKHLRRRVESGFLSLFEPENGGDALRVADGAKRQVSSQSAQR